MKHYEGEIILLKLKMILKVCIKLQVFKGNDGRKENNSRSYNNH